MILFFCDYDGTLIRGYDDGYYVTESDRLAIQDFRAKGHKFVLNSGRSFTMLSEKARKTVSADYYINSCGAEIRDGDGNVIFKKTFGAEYCREIYKRYSHLAEFEFRTGEGMYCIKGNKKVDDTYSYLDDENGLKGEFVSISLKAKTIETADMIGEEINRDYAGRISAFMNYTYIDLTCYPMSKGTGVRYLGELLSPDLTCGIGDSSNDLAMLEETDIKFIMDYAEIELPDEYIRVGDVKTALEAAVEAKRKNV